MHMQYNSELCKQRDPSGLMSSGDTGTLTGHSGKHKTRRVSTKRLSAYTRDSCDGGSGTLKSRRQSGPIRSPDSSRQQRASVPHSGAVQQQGQLQEANQMANESPAIVVEEVDECARLRRRLSEIVTLCREFRDDCSADVRQLLDRICRIAESDKEGIEKQLRVQEDGIVYHL